MDSNKEQGRQTTHKIHTWERWDSMGDYGWKCLVCGANTDDEPPVWVKEATCLCGGHVHNVLPGGDDCFQCHCTTPPGRDATLVKGLQKAVADPTTEWVDANIVRLLLDRYLTTERTSDG